jgi:hypothetical protein
MLAHSRLADAEDVGEVARAGAALLGETQRDPQANRVAECLEPGGRSHLTNYIAEI